MSQGGRKKKKWVHYSLVLGVLKALKEKERETEERETSKQRAYTSLGGHGVKQGGCMLWLSAIDHCNKQKYGSLLPSLGEHSGVDLILATGILYLPAVTPYVSRTFPPSSWDLGFGEKLLRCSECSTCPHLPTHANTH